MQKENYNSTIYALSSAEGKAGVSVIRISGNKSSEVINKLGGTTSYPRVAKITKLVDPDNGEIVDKAIAIWFPGPNSFTGEDTVELFVHGGRAVIDKIFDILARLNGLSFAEPGEFTKRSFMNGKLDLTSVEGLADLINADTELQRKQALAQMEGSLFKLYDNWRTMLIKSLSYIEANIDFIEEDLPKNILEKELGDKIDISGDHPNLQIKRMPPADRMEVCFAGRSNVGKSSLINALTGRKSLARTSNTPGRTQEINFFTLNESHYLVDVPGYGFANAPLPVVKKWQTLLKAYLSGRASLRRVFLLIDSRHGVKSVDEEIMELLGRSAVTFQVVLTKADKPKKMDLEEVISETGKIVAKYPAAFPEFVLTSSEKGDGIPTLRHIIRTLI